ncbi:hypothetical protein ACFTSD_02560 [Nocardiaceae bacterium NPDC056970]
MNTNNDSAERALEAHAEAFVSTALLVAENTALRAALRDRGDCAACPARETEASVILNGEVVSVVTTEVPLDVPVEVDVEVDVEVALDDLAGNVAEVLAEARVFAPGESVPDDVTAVRTPHNHVLTRDPDNKLWRWGLADTGWIAEPSTVLYEGDYPLTEDVRSSDLLKTDAYSLSDASALLARQGVKVGRNTLKAVLHEDLGWTDARNTPTQFAGAYVSVATAASPQRPGVVRVTPHGINALFSHYGIR